MLPAILRPNVPFFNEPGALCNDAQAASDTCPAKSRVGNARALSPLLPYPLSGPVHIVQEIGNVLPKVYVYLRGPTGLEVLLKARNSFLGGRRIINTFETVPDLPQSYFELNLNGGSNGILNNFDDLCSATDIDRQFDATFTSHSGKKVTTKPRLEIRGCEESDLRAASLTGGTREGLQERRGQGQGALQALQDLQGPPDAEGQGRHRRRELHDQGQEDRSPSR